MPEYVNISGLLPYMNLADWKNLYSPEMANTMAYIRQLNSQPSAQLAKLSAISGPTQVTSTLTRPGINKKQVEPQTVGFLDKLKGVSPEQAMGITGAVTTGLEMIGDAVETGKGTFTKDSLTDFNEDQADAFGNYNGQVFSSSNTSDILNLAGNRPDLIGEARDIKTQKYNLGKTFSNIGKGAAAGAMFGGIGAIVGAGAGLVTDLAGQLTGIFGDKARKNRAIKAAEMKENNLAAALNAGNQRVAGINYMQGMANYLNNAAMGGPLSTHGSDFTDGLIRIDNGGTHESNPYGGVPAGMDPMGIPNLVEEGETIWDNGDEEYVFSRRLKTPKSLVKKFSLGGGKDGLTYAEASKKIAEKSGANLRPNDPISKRTKDAQLAELEESQEEKRMKTEQKKLMKALSQMDPEELQGLFAAQPQDMQMAQQAPPQGVVEEPLMEEPMQGEGMYEPVGVQGFAYGGPAHILSGKNGESKKITKRQQAFRDAYRSGAIREYAPGYWSGTVPGLGYKGIGEEVAGMTTQRLLQVLGDPSIDEEVWSGVNTALSQYNEPRTAVRDTSTVSKPVRSKTATQPSTVKKTQWIAPVASTSSLPMSFYNLPESASATRGSGHAPAYNINGEPIFTRGRYYTGSETQQPVNTSTGISSASGNDSAYKSSGISGNPKSGGSKSGNNTHQVGTANVEGPWANQWSKYALPGVQNYFNGLVERYNSAKTDDERQAIRREAIDTVNNIQSGYRDIYNQFNGKTATYSDAVRAHQQAFSDVGGNYGFNGIDDDLIYGYTGRTKDNAKGTFTPDGLYGWRTALRNFGSTASGDAPKIIADLADKLDLDWTPTMDYGEAGDKLYTLSERQRNNVGAPLESVAGITSAAVKNPDKAVSAAPTSSTSPVGEAIREPLGMLPTWMRYAPVVGGGLSILSNALSPEDYSDYDNLLSASRRLSRPVNIPVVTIGDRIRRNPIDERLAVNQANQNFLAGIRGTMDNAGGNRAYRQFANNLLAYNNQGALSDIATKAYLANRQDALQTADFNRGTAIQNMNAINQRNLTQAQLNSNREQAGWNALAHATQLRDAARRLDDQYVSADFSGLMESLGNIGRENEQRNWLTSLANERVYNLAYGKNGELRYVPSVTAKCGGKVKTKKRRF